MSGFCLAFGYFRRLDCMAVNEVNKVIHCSHCGRELPERRVFCTPSHKVMYYLNKKKRIELIKQRILRKYDARS